jgi:hypothetical protein
VKKTINLIQEVIGLLVENIDLKNEIRKRPGNSVVITRGKTGYDANSGTKYIGDVFGGLAVQPNNVTGADSKHSALKKYLSNAKKVNYPIINVFYYIDGKLTHKKIGSLSWEK